jgi:hypothetical protein
MWPPFAGSKNEKNKKPAWNRYLMTEATCLSETSAETQRITQHYNAKIEFFINTVVKQRTCAEVHTMSITSNASHNKSPGYCGHFLYGYRTNPPTWPTSMRPLPKGMKTAKVSHLPPSNIESGIQSTSPSGPLFTRSSYAQR